MQQLVFWLDDSVMWLCIIDSWCINLVNFVWLGLVMVFFYVVMWEVDYMWCYCGGFGCDICGFSVGSWWFVGCCVWLVVGVECFWSGFYCGGLVWGFDELDWVVLWLLDLVGCVVVVILWGCLGLWVGQVLCCVVLFWFVGVFFVVVVVICVVSC